MKNTITVKSFLCTTLFFVGAMILTGCGKTVGDIELELPEGETLTMVWIEPGAFLINKDGPQSEVHLTDDGEFTVTFSDDKGPQTEVLIPEGYWLGATPVTQGQWEAIMGRNPSHFQSSGQNAPVENVSWDEAMEFCRKLTERERRAGRLPEGYAYTLPSEEQWEYAARAGTTTRWWFGNSESDLRRHAWYDANSDGRTHAVGQKGANPWGLYDVHGNVWEWTRSSPRTGFEDSDTDTSMRALRGGCFGSSAGFTSSDFFIGHPPDHRGISLGFRLALVPSP